MNTKERLEFIRAKLSKRRPAGGYKATGLFKKSHADQCAEPKKAGYVKIYHKRSYYGHAIRYSIGKRSTDEMTEWDRRKNLILGFVPNAA